jgi:hypothetical protein
VEDAILVQRPPLRLSSFRELLCAANYMHNKDVLAVLSIENAAGKFDDLTVVEAP